METISQTFKYLTNITIWTKKETTSHAGIYSIPCKDCSKYHIGETQRNLEKRIYEHKQSIKTNDDSNTFVSHMLELKQTFNFSRATLIKPIHCKKSRRLLESAVISKTNHIKKFQKLQVFTRPHQNCRTTYKTKNQIKIENKNKEKTFSLNATILFRIDSLSLSHFLLAPPPQPITTPTPQNWKFSATSHYTQYLSLK